MNTYNHKSICQKESHEFEILAKFEKGSLDPLKIQKAKVFVSLPVYSIHVLHEELTIPTWNI